MEKDKRFSFPIVIEQDEDGIFIASCPTFKGCHSFGNTIEEAMANIPEVIELCLDEQGEYPSENKFIGVKQLDIILPAKAI